MRHLEAHPDMRATLEQQSDVDRVLAAAVTADDRIEFCHRLGLSWPTARRHLWKNRTAVLEHAGSRLAAARRELLEDAPLLNKLQTDVRQGEIARLAALWVVRYLNGF